VLAPTCPSLTRIVIADRDRTAIRITLGDVRLGVRFPGRTFAFTPPHGARIVRP
jgi:outer membrane lipoprotein-sorting protein